MAFSFEFTKCQETAARRAAVPAGGPAAGCHGRQTGRQAASRAPHMHAPAQTVFPNNNVATGTSVAYSLKCNLTAMLRRARSWHTALCSPFPPNRGTPLALPVSTPSHATSGTPGPCSRAAQSGTLTASVPWLLNQQSIVPRQVRKCNSLQQVTQAPLVTFLQPHSHAEAGTCISITVRHPRVLHVTAAPRFHPPTPCLHHMTPSRVVPYVYAYNTYSYTTSYVESTSACHTFQYTFYKYSPGPWTAS